MARLSQGGPSGGRVWGLLSAWLIVAAASPAAGADPEPVRRALAHLADHHEPRAAILRDRRWDAATVARLAAWARGDRQDARPEDLALLDAELARPVALSVTGAVSLGNYQGGFLYYYLRALDEVRGLAARRRGDLGRAATAADARSPLALVTGASSGSINAFLSAMTSCKQRVLEPRESLFWLTWFPVGGKKLNGSTDVYSDGLLSIEPIKGAIQVVHDNWGNGGWSRDRCFVDLGLSATRMSARLIQPLEHVDLWVQMQTEKLMFHLDSAGGAMPDLTPFSPPANDPRAPLFRKLFRHLGADARPSIDDVTALLRASSAFSFAFPPGPLKLLVPGDGKDNAFFTDGGVFDDRPVGLALEMRRWRVALDEAGAPAVRGQAPPEPRFVIQDPDATDEPPTKSGSSADDLLGGVDEPKHPAFLKTWFPFMGDFLNTAFEIELLDTLEREPELYGQVEIPPRRMPVAGAYLMEFMAFAEADFRIFDFYSGMVDAWQQLGETSLAFQVLEAAGQGPTFQHAPEFDCLLAWRAPRVLAPNHAAPPPSDACAAVGVEDPKHLDAGLRRNIEALARASANTRDWSAAPGKKSESEERHFLNALGAAPAFVFSDLGYHGGPATPATAELAIRDVMQEMLGRATSNQPLFSLDRFVVGSVGKAAANAYVYRPPAVFAAAGLVSDRGVELIGARRFSPDSLPGLRIDGALRFLGIHVGQDATLAAPSQVLAWTAMAAAHLTNEFQWKDSAILEPHLGLGWAVKAQLDAFAPLLWRQGPEVLLGAAFFQRLYLDVAGDYFLDDCAGNNKCANVSSKVTPGAAPIAEAAWSLRLSLGYRFYLN